MQRSRLCQDYTHSCIKKKKNHTKLYKNLQKQVYLLKLKEKYRFKITVYGIRESFVKKGLHSKFLGR